MNANPALAGGVTGGVLLIALILIVMSIRSGGPQEAATTKDFYSIDDGVTSFVDEAFPTRVPPFQHQGKTAYRAHVWTCDGGKTTFVSGLQKFSDQAKKTLDGLVAAKNFDHPTINIVRETWEGSLMKPAKTGDTPDQWFPYTNPKSNALLVPTCPSGTLDKPVAK